MNMKIMPVVLAGFEMNTETFPESWNVWDSFTQGSGRRV